MNNVNPIMCASSFFMLMFLLVSSTCYGESTSEYAAISPEELESLKNRISLLEKQSEGGFLSRKKKWFELSGELELEYRDSQGDGSEIDRQVGYMGIDKVVLSPKVRIDEDVKLSLSFIYTTDGTEVDKAYITFKDLWLDSSLVVGFDDRFFYRGGTQRKTEGSPLIRSAYFRVNEYQVTWSGKKNIFNWHASISQGIKLGKKQPGEDSSYKFLADRSQDNKGEKNQNKAISAGFGVKNKIGKSAKYDVMAFFYNAKLTDDDIAVLQGIAGYQGGDDDDAKRIAGGYFTYQIGGFDFDTMYVKSKDGELDRDGWYVRTAYKVKVAGWKTFNAYDFVLRYDELNIDLPAVDGTSFSETATWDRTQTTAAVIIDMYKYTKLKLEYYINDEETGGDDVSNDEFLAQLEVKF